MIIRWIITIIAIILSAYLIPGVSVEGFWSAFWVSIFIGLINITLKPILIILTLPINIVTLGLFTFIINGVLILLASSVIQGFSVAGLMPAIIFSIVLAFMNWILNKVFDTKK